jgi:hypothetical protein
MASGIATQKGSRVGFGKIKITETRVRSGFRKTEYIKCNFINNILGKN